MRLGDSDYAGTVRRIGLLVLVVACACSIATAPASAQATASEHDYDGAELLTDGSVTTSGTVTLTPNGTAQKGDTIRIAIDKDESAFEIASVADETGSGIDVALNATAETIDIELTDLGGDGSLDGAEIEIGVDLTATDAVASDATEYDSTPIATVVRDETEAGLVGAEAIDVSVSGTAEFEFDADSIDEKLRGDNLQIIERNEFLISFSDNSVSVDNGETINISVDPEVVDENDTDGLRIVAAGLTSTQNDNISSVDVTTSSGSDVLDGYADQITATINTVDKNTKIISDESISITAEIAVEKEAMKYAADRYRNVDLFTVDVEGENNTELTDNADIATESPVRLDIYPGEASADRFELGEIGTDGEFGASEERTLAVDGLEDRYGNEIRRAKVDIVREDAIGRNTSEDWVATDGTDGPTVGTGGDIDVPVGNAEISVEVLDVPGPAAQSDNTGAAVTETAPVAVYPDNVTVSTTAEHRDFDVDPNATAEIAIDLGVADGDIGEVDVVVRRERGNGSVTFDSGAGTPTATDLWRGSGETGDGALDPESAWIAERNLTASDFDGGVRRYVVDADAADRYEISAEVMPHEASLNANASAIETSLTDDPGGWNRDSVEVVATGPIAAVRDVSVLDDREFVGIDSDEGEDVEIEFGGFADANGNAVTATDETLPVRVGEADAGRISPGTGSTAIEIDPTAIDPGTVDTGSEIGVTIGTEGGEQRNETALTAVHRVIERPEGAWRTSSLSQPAALYVDADGRRDLVQWDPGNGTYEGIAAGSSGDTLGSSRIGHEQLHRGVYAYAESGTLRIGFEYATGAEGAIETGELDLGPGWHLASSNYDVSSHRNRSLDDDLIWAERGFGDDEDAFTVWNRNRTERIHDETEGLDIDGSAEAVGHDEAYWIEIDNGTEPLTRVVNGPVFSENDGVRE